MSVAIIAARAGVSNATVSRVLNNSPRVNPETARLVREAARQIRYDPSKARRGPRIGGRAAREIRTFAILAIGNPHERWFREALYTAAVSSITRAAGEQGARVVIRDVMDDSSAAQDDLQGGEIDGAIAFVFSRADRGLVERIAKRIPVVRVMGEESTYPEIDQVRTDNTAVGVMAHQYLHQLGCARTAFLTSWPELDLFVSRGIGFCTAAGRAGAARPDVFVARHHDGCWPIAAGATPFDTLDEIADLFASRPDRPTGLLVSTDQEAIGLYARLERRGIVPGRDVKIIGCNNDQSGLSMLAARPATFDIGTAEYGPLAVSRLMHRIANPNCPPIRMLVTPRLVLPPTTPSAAGI